MSIHSFSPHSFSTSSSLPFFDLHTPDSDTLIKSLITKDPTTFINVIHRITSNSNHSHPHILPYKAYHIENQASFWKIFIKVEKMEANLLQVLEAKKESDHEFSKAELVRTFYSLLTALDFLHSSNMCHNNLKSENVLFDKDGNAYLTDIISYNSDNKELAREYGESKSEAGFNEQEDLLTKDLINMGLIFLMMCECKRNLRQPTENVAKAQEFYKQRVHSIRGKYGKDVADLIGLMIMGDVNEKVNVKSLLKFLENNFCHDVLRLQERNNAVAEAGNQNNMMTESSVNVLRKVPPKLAITNGNMQEQMMAIRDQFYPRKGSDSATSLSGTTNYLYLPYRCNKSIRNLSKYGVMDNRSLNILKKCNKLGGSLQNLKKVGKKVEFSGIEIVQSDNAVRIPNSTRPTKVQQLGWNLSHFANIKEFQIEFTSDTVTCKDLVYFGKSLFRYKELKKLRVGFVCGQTFCDYGMKSLGNAIKKNKYIEDLHLSLNRWVKATEKGFTSLIRSISKLTKLKRFVLDIEEFQQIGNISMIELGQDLAKLTHLTELELNFFRCSCISGQQLEILSEYLAKLTNLKKLSINMKQARGMMNMGVTALGKRLNNLRELRELKLNFLSCDVGETGFDELSMSLRNMKQLNVLELTFGNNDQVTNKCFEAIGNSLGELSHLRSLKLVFFQCDKLTDVAVYSLAEALDNLANLSELELNFRWCMQITDSGITRLGEAFLNLVHLNRLGLSFDGCRISDAGVSKLGQDLAKLQYLDGFKLEVRDCKGIQGTGISKLGECLTKLVKLGQIQLNFCGCGGTYRQRFNEGIISLRKSISKLPNVTNLDQIAPYC